ncbi:MAG: hypothetical protein U0802_15955 [Candidatus Binatia bacterium]
MIQKEYERAELIEAARQIFALGWQALKLYFMLGLPGEEEADLVAIADLAARWRPRRERRGHRQRLDLRPQAARLDSSGRRRSTSRRPRRASRCCAASSVAPHPLQVARRADLLPRGDLLARRARARAAAAGRLPARLPLRRLDQALPLRRLGGGAGRGRPRRARLPAPPLRSEVLPWDHLSCGVTKAYRRT